MNHLEFKMRSEIDVKFVQYGAYLEILTKFKSLAKQRQQWRKSANNSLFNFLIYKSLHWGRKTKSHIKTASRVAFSGPRLV